MNIPVSKLVGASIALFINIFNLIAQCDFPALTPNDIVYVKEQGSGDKTGTSWDNALDGRLLNKYLKEKALDNTQIYVAEGVYYPYYNGCDVLTSDPNSPRDFSFLITKNLIMKGGYAATSTGTDLSNRNIYAQTTRLSGELQQDGITTNNAFHVITVNIGLDPLLEGFYISDGYAEVSTNDQQNGGGIFDQGGESSIARFSMLVIENNAASFGGGIYFKSNLVSILNNIIFRNNQALNGSGGSAIFAWGNFGLINSEVSNNTNGPAVVSWGGDFSVRNSTISNNGQEGIRVDAQDTTKFRVIGSTIANNAYTGIRIKNANVNPAFVTINIDNSLIVNNNNDPANNPANNLFLNESNASDTVNLSYTISGNIKYNKNLSPPVALPLLVELDGLNNNGGFGQTRALLNVCNNPATNRGNPGLFEDSPLNQNDQRGVPRNHPFPCIGAYDGIQTGHNTTMWTGGGNDSDWNNPANWNAGIPGVCTTVTIPESSSYPQINPQSNAASDTIVFQSGGEIGGIDNLQYTSAKVELSLNPNRWYMVAPPLQGMYSGDYFIEGSIKRFQPAVYAMQYQTQNPQKPEIQAAAGEWSKPFNTLDVNFTPGLSCAIWIDNGTLPDPEFTFRFPKDSTVYKYYNRGGTVTGSSGVLVRTGNDRFIFEQVNSNTSGFEWPVNDTYSTFMTGNPFMSHLDFSKLQAANSDKIDPVYYVWTGTEFDANIPGNWSNMPNEIAPMQSFLLQKKTGAPSFSFVQINPDMSVTAPGNSIRNASSDDNYLEISILRNNIRHSRIKIFHREGVNNHYNSSKDAWTVFSNSYQSPAILYTLLDGKAASLRTMSDFSEPLALGVRTSEKGALTIRINDLDYFYPGSECYLEDRLTGTIQNLRETPAYTFSNESGDIENRFFLRISTQSTGSPDIRINPGILVTKEQDFIRITSSTSDPIRQVDIYDLMGIKLDFRNHMNTSNLTIPFKSSNNIILVKVRTENTQESFKLK